MARNTIKSKFRTSKMADLSEMARNALQSDFRTCIQNGRWKKKNLYWSEMARIAIASEFRKSKMADRSEMVRSVIESEFRTSKWPEMCWIFLYLVILSIVNNYRWIRWMDMAIQCWCHSRIISSTHYHYCIVLFVTSGLNPNNWWWYIHGSCRALSWCSFVVFPAFLSWDWKYWKVPLHLLVKWGRWFLQIVDIHVGNLNMEVNWKVVSPDSR